MAVALDWDEMIKELHRALEGDSADVDEIKRIMSSYKADPKDWKKFALLDPYKYTRNLVDDGNGKFNLMLLAWNLGQASSVHDHAGSHCFMKVLDGTVQQELYDMPKKENAPLNCCEISDHGKDEILYIDDTIGLHRIANESHAEPAFTLHLYSPPYSECHCFDERCGKARPSGKMTFFSKQGKKLAPLER